MGFEWSAIEEAAAQQLISAVQDVRENFAEQNIYAAIVHEFYGDGSAIYWPMVSIGTEETLERAELRFSGPDLVHCFEPDDELQELADKIQAYAAAQGSFENWSAVYERFLLCFPAASRLAREQLIATGIVEGPFIAFADDEEQKLLALSLSKEQIYAHFPQLAKDDQERSRLLSLTPEDRAAEVLEEAVLPRYQGQLVGEHEELLIACDAAAVPLLVQVVRGEIHRNGALVAARLLAQINHDSAEVREALELLMCSSKADVNTRSWAASALARLGHSEVILKHVSRLPRPVVVRGISDPLSSFRDRGAHGPLDYSPLERLLEDYPDFEEELAVQLRPGSGYCSIDTAEADTARSALASPFEFIRIHARLVLDHD